MIATGALGNLDEQKMQDMAKRLEADSPPVGGMSAAAGVVSGSLRAPRLAASRGDSVHARVELLPEPACVAGARRVTRDVLGRLGWPAYSDDGVLLVSELVTNATAQAVASSGGRPAIIVTLYGNPAELSVLVWDNGPCDGLRAEPGMAGADAESGRGLSITATLTGGEWGWWETPGCGGKVVWGYLGASP
jgi:anti-sigma regulatory factor (Ser/Thr protein kinase)